MAVRKDLHEQNRRSWNAALAALESHKTGQARFLKAGGSTLFPEELALLGDVRGKELVHLLCNAGEDTLSLARLGARVTGVDISDAAIERARALAAEAGLAARFERADAYDFLDAAPAAGFDVAFLSYGAVPWLSDLEGFVRGAARLLRPGGRLVAMEYHPIVYPMAEDLRFDAGYGLGAHHAGEGVGDYVAQSGEALAPSGFQAGVAGFRNPEAAHSFHWSVADLVNAVRAAGLELDALEEHGHANGCRLFPSLVALPGRRFGLPPGAPRIPLMLGLRAVRR